MKRGIFFLIMLCSTGQGNVFAQNPLKERLLYSLTPKSGFFKSNQELALLDGRINSYYPADGINPEGLVIFAFYEYGNESDQHVRLFSTAHGIQRMSAEFDVETTCMADTNFFSFYLLKDEGDYTPLGQPFMLPGALKQTIKVFYNSDGNGNAQVKMIGTRKAPGKCTFWLRSIKVYQIEK